MSDEEERENALIKAIRTSEADRVRLALESGARLETYSRYGETPLGVAAGMGSLDIMRLLLTRGADPDEDDYEGDTAIEKALQNGQQAAIELLLDWGTVEAQAQRAVDALQSAARYCHLPFVQRLIDRGVDINGTDQSGLTALIELTRLTHNRKLSEEQATARRQIIRLLMERGADVHKRYTVTWPGREPVPISFTAMYHAAHSGDAYTVDLLRQAGAEITFTEAAALGDWETVRLMLGQGQYPNWRDMNGETGLYYAAHNGHTAIVRVLLEAGADPYLLRSQGSFDQTPLSAAWEEGHMETVALILETTLGVDPNWSRAAIGERLGGASGRNKLLALLLGPDGAQSEQGGYRGLTPLMEAAYSDNVVMANLLLGAGCGANVGNDVDYTPLMIACEQGALATARLLLEAGADPNRRNAQGNTALICAIGNGATENLRRSGYSEEICSAMQAKTLEIVRLLLEAGAEVNAQSDYCLTPLDYAVDTRQDDIAALLRAAGAVTSEENA